MKQVRILQPVAGLDFSWQPDDIVEMPDEDAAKWADGFRGELYSPRVAVKPKPETPEQAVPRFETPEANAEQPVRRSPGRLKKTA